MKKDSWSNQKSKTPHRQTVQFKEVATQTTSLDDSENSDLWVGLENAWAEKGHDSMHRLTRTRNQDVKKRNSRKG